MKVNEPAVVQEVTQAVLDYEQALVHNDVAALDRFFWNSAETVRLGARENLFGYQAIAEFRRQRSPKGLEREVVKVAITTFGDSLATAHVIFKRPHQSLGRQSQTWLRTQQGWQIVSAHVSNIA
ncbi:oxalurate catabolism protein HpxZ [Celerinatantimonas sp. YJH-8]|uniref:oxalurate catabolism protein HpxZ n=1 Tax=Celerinatantimonas sp. YJH-8 TaxID=3228714 RepID=UPI0038C3FEAC